MSTAMASTSTSRPMAITMGDPSGVGPEIVLRHFAAVPDAFAQAVVYGDVSILRHGAELLDLKIDIVAIDAPGDARQGVLNVLDLAGMSVADHRPGTLGRGFRCRCTRICRTCHRRCAGWQGCWHRHATDEQGGAQLTDPSLRRPPGVDRRTSAAFDRVTMMLTATARSLVTHVSTHCSLRRGDQPGRTPSASSRSSGWPPTSAPVDRRAAHRSCGPEPARGGARPVRQRGIEHIAPAIEAACAEASTPPARTPPTPSSIRRPPRPLRRDRVHVPRPGASR